MQWKEGLMEHVILRGDLVSGDLGCNLGAHLGAHLGLETYVVEMSEDLIVCAIEMSH